NGAVCSAFHPALSKDSIEFRSASFVLAKKTSNPIRHLRMDKSSVDLVEDAQQLLELSGAERHGTANSEGPQTISAFVWMCNKADRNFACAMASPCTSAMCFGLSRLAYSSSPGWSA